ncbi:MAG: thiamine phosphate synthase [Desulfuromonadales bacterium]|nr:thiamine phosphate synthase [Desulfuromonadales bacterium]
MPPARLKVCLVDFALYLITDRMQTAGRTLPAVVADALRGGLRAVQLREKDLNACQLFDLAVQLREITRRHDAKLLINDRIDVALAVGADGVHLGKAGLPVPAARRILGAGRLIGYSAHSLEEALLAQDDGADFVTLGPVYQTPSKSAYGAPLGLDAVAKAARSLAIPVFALGGVKPASVAGILSAGVHGIALIAAIIAAGDPAEETEMLLRTIADHAEPS